MDAPVWVRLLWPVSPRAGRDQPSSSGTPSLRVVCPHCTNSDTLTRHCSNGRCGWVHCTCGALVYSRRRHRHPRHGSDADTCHDPAAAA
jgi:hypothetical protein